MPGSEGRLQRCQALSMTASLRHASGVETILPVTLAAAGLRCSLPALCTGLLYSQAMPLPEG